MSQRLISRNPDLKKLRDAGFDVSVVNGSLVIRDVPYVAGPAVVKRGVLVSDLELAGDLTVKPKNHVASFAGDYPCDKHGKPLEKIRHQSQRRPIDASLVVEHSFSSKPAGGYADYYDKITTYVAIMANEAAALEPHASAKTYPVVEADVDESVFNYFDTASSRMDIESASRKLEGGIIAIVGLGGTGSYVLDLVAKTSAEEIHLFDGDDFLTHNAFRAPGAPSIERLREKPRKATYFATIYSAMHRHVIPHDHYLDATNVQSLDAMDFVFLCLDDGVARKILVQHLENQHTSFIDVGMGLDIVDESLGGVLRVVASTKGHRDHVRHRIPFGDGGDDNVYAKNIQVADLNALNAALAVVKWKKLRGFYRDFAREHFSAYTTDGNRITNGEV